MFESCRRGLFDHSCKENVINIDGCQCTLCWCLNQVVCHYCVSFPVSSCAVVTKISTGIKISFVRHILFGPYHRDDCICNILPSIVYANSTKNNLRSIFSFVYTFKILVNFLMGENFV